MAPQASKKCGLLPPDHKRIGCCASNRLNSGKIPGAFFVLTISSLSRQGSAYFKKRFMTRFSVSGSIDFTLTSRRWKMKRFCRYFFVSGLMLGSLLLQYDTASALDSTMAHHDKGSGTTTPSGCVSDMTDPTQLGAQPQTFRLCVFNSGATDWSAEIRKDSYPYQLVSGCSMAKVSVAIQTSFSCSVITPGSYRGLFTYWVGTTQKGHTDRKFVR